MCSVSFVELKPNSALLDPNFDGYKLSLDGFPRLSLDLPSPLYTPPVPSDMKYSYAECRTFLLFNSLFEDSFSLNCVYFVDASFRVNQVSCVFSQLSTRQVFTIPALTQESASCALPPRVVFSSTDTAVVSNGAQSVYFLETGYRSKPDHGNPSWNLLSKLDLSLPGCFLWYSICVGEHRDFVIVYESFEHCKKERVRLTYERVVVKSGLSTSVGGASVVGRSCPDMVSVDATGLYLQVAANSPFGQDSPETSAFVSTQVKFTAICVEQDHTSLSLQYKFEGESTDIASAEIEKKSLTVKLGETLVHSGTLVDSVDPNQCTSSFADSVLTLALVKETPGLTWTRVVEGDDTVQMPAEEKDAAEVGAEGDKPFNVEELELCDDMSGSDLSQWQLFRLVDDSLQPVTASRLHSHEILFSRVTLAGEQPSLCLRHDVDALLWETTTENLPSNPWQHAMTFHAFGYVQASKRDRKFISCTPSCQLVALAECSRRVLLYQRPEHIHTALVNRNTGRRVPSVAKQFVLSFDTNQPIQGMVCYNDYIYVLFDNVVHAFCLL